MTTITENTLDTSWLDTFTQAFKNHRFIQLLGALLVFQLLVAFFFGLKGLTTGEFEKPAPLFSIAKDSVTTLEISDASQTVQLVKEGETWMMGPEKSLPVDESRVATLLNSLEGLNAGLPVASSENARAQLKVADDSYQRKLSINSGNDETTLLLGTSPGIRKSHVRLAGSDNIYSASLPVSDVPSSVDSWLDKSLLAFKDISKISTNDVTFQLSGGEDEKKWSLINGDVTINSIDSEKLLGLVSSLENLRVNGVGEKLQPESIELAGQENDASPEQTDSASTDSEELLSFEVSLSNDSTEVILDLQRLGDRATAHRRDIAGYYAIPTALFDNLSSLSSETEWIIEEPVEDNADSE